MFGLVGFAEATGIVLHDHFDDGTLDPAWSISFKKVTAWSYRENGTFLNVTDMATTGSGWASVNLTRYLTTPLSNFNIDFKFSWDSESGLRAMQNVLVQAYAQDGTKITEAGYSDGWLGAEGAKYGLIGGALIDTGPNSVASPGSASVNIHRTGNVIEILWNGSLLISGIESNPVHRVDLVFSHHVNAEPGETSFFGTEAVDLVRVEGTAPAVPEPTTILLLSTGMAGLVGSRLRGKKRTTRTSHR